MTESSKFDRYQELQRYVGWTEKDAAHIQAVGPLVEKYFGSLVEDLFQEIQRHLRERKVISGGQAQIDGVKEILLRWLQELFSGQYDGEYVRRRWHIGLRHVEIGLSQVYTIAAFSRLRGGLIDAVDREWQGSGDGLLATRMSINRVLDLDLALIEDAYQTEFHRREQSIQRLITIGHVAGGIAHELRNPLNVIKTSVYFLLNSQTASPEKVRSHLQRIDRQVAISDAVITALNNFARLPVPDLQTVDPSAFLSELTETLELPQNVEVRSEYTDAIGFVLGDPHQLSIVFSNLIRNACDAMPQGGQLQITAVTADAGIEISVRDTGIGIKSDVLQRVMDPLFTTKTRGIGLGLAISRAIVEKHNGRLTATSGTEQGTIFTVWLPRATVIEKATES